MNECAWCEAACDKEMEALAAVTEGGRNHALNTAAWRLGRLAAGGGHLTLDGIAGALLAACHRNGLARDPSSGYEEGVRRTITSAFRAGESNPRGCGATLARDSKWGAPVQYVPEAEPAMPVELRFYTDDELGELPEPRPVIDRMLTTESLAWIGAAPGTYKSFLAIDMCLSIASGARYRSLPTAEGPTLYVAAEGRSGLARRVRAWKEANRIQQTQALWLPEAVPVTTPAWDQLIRQAEPLRPVLIALDTQAHMAGQLEENAAEQMGQFTRHLGRLRDATGACILTIHHATKAGDSMRGSSSLTGAADTIMTVTRPPGTDNVIKVECLKQKDLAPFHPYWLEAVPHAQSLTLIECEEPRHAA